MVKHTQTIRRLLPMNCLNVIDHFVGLALKRLIFTQAYSEPYETCNREYLANMVDHFQNLHLRCFAGF